MILIIVLASNYFHFIKKQWLIWSVFFFVAITDSIIFDAKNNFEVKMPEVLTWIMQVRIQPATCSNLIIAPSPVIFTLGGVCLKEESLPGNYYFLNCDSCMETYTAYMCVCLNTWKRAGCVCRNLSQASLSQPFAPSPQAVGWISHSHILSVLLKWDWALWVVNWASFARGCLIGGFLRSV